MIRALAENTFCRAAAAQVLQHNCEFTVNQEGLVVREARIDGEVSIVIFPSLRRHTLMLSQYFSPTKHLDQHRMGDAIRQTFCWPHKAAEVSYVLRNCTTCDRNNLRYRRRRQIPHFAEGRPLEFLVMAIVGPVPINSTRQSKRSRYCGSLI